MKHRVLAAFAAVTSCICVAAILFLAAWRWSLTNETMTVFVNDVDNADEAECVWTGSQHFDVTLPEATARFRVMLCKPEHRMSAFIDARKAQTLRTDSIKLRLVYKRVDGSAEVIPVTPMGASVTEHSVDGSVRSWLQDFRIIRDLKDAPEGTVSLWWSMGYRDAGGEIRKISVTIPLRKKEITVPGSIVRFDERIPNPNSRIPGEPKRGQGSPAQAGGESRMEVS